MGRGAEGEATSASRNQQRRRPGVSSPTGFRRSAALPHRELGLEASEARPQARAAVGRRVLRHCRPQEAWTCLGPCACSGSLRLSLPLRAGCGCLRGLLAGLGPLWQVQLQDVVQLGEEGQQQLRVGLPHRLLELPGELQLVQGAHGLSGQESVWPASPACPSLQDQGCISEMSLRGPWPSRLPSRTHRRSWALPPSAPRGASHPHPPALSAVRPFQAVLWNPGGKAVRCAPCGIAARRSVTRGSGGQKAPEGRAIGQQPRGFLHPLEHVGQDVLGVGGSTGQS